MPGSSHPELVGIELHIARTAVGLVDPSATVTAGIAGELYWDSVTKKFYIAEDATDSDWEEALGAGDVEGPSSAVSGALTYFPDDTGDTIDDIPGLTSDGTDLLFADSISAIWGDGSDFTIGHDGTDTTLTSTTGDLLLDNTSTTGATVIRLGSDNVNTSLQIQNNSESSFLKIEHDSTAGTAITTTADLNILAGSGGVVLVDADSIRAGTFITSAVEIGHTGSAGRINSRGTGNLEFQLDDVVLMELSDAAVLSLPDGGTMALGDGSDLILRHSGTNGLIQSDTGDLVIDNTDADGVTIIRLGADDADPSFQVQNDSGDMLFLVSCDGTNTTWEFDFGELSLVNGSGGEFLFNEDSFRAGPSATEYVESGHRASNAIINGVTSGLVLLQRNGQSIMTFDSGLGVTFTGDVFGDGFFGSDFDGSNYVASVEVTAPKITPSQTLSFREGSTQWRAAVPDLHTGRIGTGLLRNSEDISAQSSSPQHMYMREDGQKMYVVDNNSDSVHEYDLSESGVTSSMSFLRSFSVSAQDNNPVGIFFKPDGLVMYVSGQGSENVYQYVLGTAWNISTASHDETLDVSSNSLNPRSITFSPDGEAFFVTTFGDGQLSRWGMSTPWNIGSAGFEDGFIATEPGDIIGVGFRSDGAIMCLSSSGDDAIYEYFLGTPWNITANIVYLGSVSLDSSTAVRGIFFSTLNDKFYSADAAGDAVMEYDLGLLVEGKIKSGPASVVDIYDNADFSALLISGGAIVVSEDVTFRFHGDVSTAIEISVDSGISLHIDGDGSLTYTGDPGPFISCEGSVYISDLPTLESTDDATLIAKTGAGTVSVRGVRSLTGWDLGSADDGEFYMYETRLTDLVNGLFLDHNTVVDVANVVQDGATLGADIFNLDTNNPSSVMSFSNVVALSLSSSGSIFDFSSKMNNSVVANVRDCRVALDSTGTLVGNLFEPATGSSDDFTAVADGTISAGSITAQVSNGSGGTTHSCTTTYYEDEEITISGTTSYDGTFQIFNVVAGVSFDTITAFVANDATGSVATIRLTITLEAGHSVATGDPMKIFDSDFYNGFYTALNIATNTLTLNGVFVVTETGSIYDDISVDQTDPRVNVKGCSGFPDSRQIASAYVNDNAVNMGAMVNDTWQDMAFGTTAAGALIAGSNMEGWRLVDAENGTLEYQDNVPFNGRWGYDYSLNSSGGAEQFGFKHLIDLQDGSGFVDLPDPVETEQAIGSNDRNVSKTFPLLALKGYQIKPLVVRRGGNSTLVADFASFYAAQ